MKTPGTATTRFVLVLAALFLASACTYSFTSRSALNRTHDAVRSDGTLEAYYRIDRADGEAVLRLTVRNAAATFMSGLVLTVTARDRAGAAFTTTRSLGNLKSGTSKSFTAPLPAAEGLRITMNYSFNPMDPLAPLRPEQYPGERMQPTPRIAGSLILPLP